MSTEDIRKKLWLLSILLSLLFLLAIFIIWGFVSHHYVVPTNQITSLKELRKFIKPIEERNPIDGLPIFIPTGIYLHSFYFKDPTTVSVSGIIWQKFPKIAFAKGIKPGVIFSEANQKPNLLLLYKKEKPNYILYGWQFWGVTLYQGFEYSLYPFDTQTIWIRIWSQNLFDNVMLVPDLESYRQTGYYDTFGIELFQPLKEFTVKETYFNFKKISYYTNFGLPNYGSVEYPELFFNIVVRRKFLNSFILYLMPVIVVWAILFGLVMVMSSDPEQAKTFGFSTTGTLSALGGSFFAILIAQANLRNNFLGHPLMYLEYFYITTYVLIFFLALNAYLTTPRKGVSRVLAWENNLLPKILFWPTLLGSITLATFLKFFWAIL